MKNKYVTKILCTTLASAMILSNTVGVLGAEASSVPETEIVEDGDVGDGGMDSSEFDSSGFDSSGFDSSDSDVAGTDSSYDSDDLEGDSTIPDYDEMPDYTGTPEPTPDIDQIPETPEPTPDITETPEPTETPKPSETPDPEPSETPKPSETPAPTPGDDPVEIPGDVDEGAVNRVIGLIDALNGSDITKAQLNAARKAYNSLSDAEKALVSNYGILKNAEDSFVDTVPDTGGNQTPGNSGSSGGSTGGGDYNGGGSGNSGSTGSAGGSGNTGNTGHTGNTGNAGNNTGNTGNTGSSGGGNKGNVTTEKRPQSDYKPVKGKKVTYSGGTYNVSNLHAGRDFYLDQLEDTYQLAFDDEFADVMDSIEKDYKKKNKISDDTEILVRNWQDILAVYVLKQNQAGADTYTLDKTSKKELAEIFEEMNPVTRDKKNILKISYGNLHVDDYMDAHKGELKKKEKVLLNKYTSKDCALLSATVTAAKGFIRQSAGDDISEERVNIIAAGYSLVGKVSYFWGGKSTVIGWDSSWGTPATVSAGGSRSSGSVRAYGLDCSGFITWAFVNGYQDKKAASLIGDGTTAQWEHCETIDAKDAQPGDLVFQRGPEGGSNNHVGILVGQTEEGDWIAVHCSSGQNGVVVGEAYSASFRYIRRPSAYPTKEEVVAAREKKENDFLEQVLALKTDDSSKKSIYKKANKTKSIVAALED